MKQKELNDALRISIEGNIDDAMKLQKDLIAFINLDNRYSKDRFIAGVDLSYAKDSCYCAIIVIDRTTMKINEKVYSVSPVTFPYVPGLLFFREFPAFFEAFKKLKTKPDILIFDGQGLSHQRMMGLATMAGILLDIPSIGCAKSYLYGEYKEPGQEKFSSSELIVNKMRVGYVFRTKENLKPVFISTGYKVSPESSLEIVKSMITSYKLPLPTLLAHRECENYKKHQILKN